MRRSLVLCVAFVSAISSSPAHAEKWTVKRFGPWRVEAAKDPISEKERVYASVTTNDPRGAWLRVACYEGVPTLAVSFPDIKYRPKERVAVVLRIDDRAPTKGEYESIPDTGIAEQGLTRITYEALTAMSKIAMRVYRETGDSRTATFPVKNSAAALAIGLRACPLDSGGKSVPVAFDPQKPIFEALEEKNTSPNKGVSKPDTAISAEPALSITPSELKNE